MKLQIHANQAHMKGFARGLVLKQSEVRGSAEMAFSFRVFTLVDWEGGQGVYHVRIEAVTIVRRLTSNWRESKW